MFHEVEYPEHAEDAEDEHDLDDELLVVTIYFVTNFCLSQPTLPHLSVCITSLTGSNPGADCFPMWPLALASHIKPCLFPRTRSASENLAGN